MVGGILSYNLGYPYAVVVASTITAYTVFTVKVSDWRAGEAMRMMMMMMMMMMVMDDDWIIIDDDDDGILMMMMMILVTMTMVSLCT